MYFVSKTSPLLAWLYICIESSTMHRKNKSM